MGPTPSFYSCAIVLANLAAAVSTVSPAWAQPSKGNYSASKSFTLKPTTGAATGGIWSHFEHAWLKEGPVNLFDVSTGQDSKTFLPFGEDALRTITDTTTGKFANYKVFNGNLIANPGGGKEVNTNPIAVAPMTMTTLTAKVSNPVTTSSSQASSSYTLGKVAADGSISGQVSINGSWTVQAIGGDAYAFSYSRMDVLGPKPIAVGRAEVLPKFGFVGLSEQVVTGGGRGPVYFEAVDPNDPANVLAAGSLLDISYDIRGPGSFLWDGSTFTVDASNADFHIAIDDQFITSSNRGGEMDLTIRNGIVTQSMDSTGIFIGGLPGVGSSGSFTTSTISVITLDYNLGDFDGHDADIAFAFDSASGILTAVPEPTGLTLCAIGAIGLLAYGRRIAKRNCRRGSLPAPG
jgi:hypothetical protein